MELRNRKVGIKQAQNLVNSRFAGLLRRFRTRGRALTPPLFIELVLTYRCNLTCSYCYQDHRKNLGEMTLEHVQLIHRHMSSLRLRPRLFIYGGEPTENRDFVKILTFLSDQGYSLFMTSNGIGGGGVLDQVIHLPGLKSLELSLHPGNQAALPELARRLSGAGSRVRVSVNCPVDHVVNSGEGFEHFISRFASTGIDSLSFQHPHRIDYNEAERFGCEFFRELRAVQSRSHNLPVLFFPLVRSRDLERYYRDPSFPGLVEQCVLPWLDMLIQPNGDVIPCDELGLVMGNVYQQEVRRIWNNDRYRGFRRNLLSRGTGADICHRCSHRHYL